MLHLVLLCVVKVVDEELVLLQDLLVLASGWLQDKRRMHHFSKLNVLERF